MSGQLSRSPFHSLITLAIAAVTAAACNLQISTDVEAKDQWTRSYPISAAGTLSIANGNGRITVDAADIQTIEITAERIVRAGTEALANEQLKAIDMREEVNDDRVSLDSSTRGLTVRMSRRINYTVRVPRSVAVVLETSNSDITATGLGGAFSASASNGRVTGVDLSGAVRVSATNGVVSLTMAAVAADGITADTTNGAITVTVPGATNASLTARVTNGSISHENLNLTISENSRRRVDGRLGDGGPPIRLETTNGSVRIIGR